MLEINGPEAFATTFGVSRETIERLRIYEQVLVKWQKSINLIAPSTLGTVWHRHFADSAQLVPIAREHARRHPGSVGEEFRHWVDLGSGAGFPGLVVAALLAELGPGEAWRVTLVESDTRKAAFLAEAARQMGISPGKLVEILPRRIELAATQISVGQTRIVSARALAPLVELLHLARPLFREGTLGLFLKGKEVDAELSEARKRFEFGVDLVPSLTGPTGRIVIVSSLRSRQRDD